MKKKLVVYLLSYKRPEYIIEAIDSILAQTYKNFDLIISENSPDNIVFNQIQNYKTDPHVQIIKRNPSLPALDHFNLILKECQIYEYAMLFHDDDVLMLEALTEMMVEIEKKTNLAAISCNAYLAKSTVKTKNLFNSNLKKNTFLTDCADIIKGYTLPHFGHTPFPSYIYRTQYLRNLRLNKNNGGKHSDVSFLTDLIESESILWIPAPLMYYRQHASNDSATTQFKDIMSLCSFFLKKSPASVLYILLYFSKNLIKNLVRKVYNA